MDATKMVDGVYIHAEGPDCWCGPDVSEAGVFHQGNVGETHQISDIGPKGPAELIQQTG